MKLLTLLTFILLSFNSFASGDKANVACNTEVKEDLVRPTNGCTAENENTEKCGVTTEKPENQINKPPAKTK